MDQRKLASWRAAFPLALVVLLACRSEPGPVAHPLGGTSSRSERTAELFFTTGLLGTVEPCGCTTRPLGGIARLAARVGAGPDRALVDAGQLLLPEEGIDGFTRPQHLLKASLIARVFRRLGAVAVNLTPSDLGEGLGLLEKLQREGAVPLVSANVRPRDDQGPSVARSSLRTIGEIRFGFTGVTLPEAAAEAAPELTALEFAPAVRAEVAALRESGAEVIVVLAHLPDAEARALAEAEPGIDLILRAPGSPSGDDPAPPTQVGPVVLAEAGREGQYVGRARFRVGPAGTWSRPFELDDGGARAKSEIARLARRLDALRAEVARLAEASAPPEAVAAREALIAELEAARAAPAERSAGGGPSVQVEVLPLEATDREDEGVSRALAAYYRALRDMNHDRGDPADCEAEPGAPRFVGNAACGGCHRAAMEFWRGTNHAKAWSTLERQAKHYDLTCVGCHTVGFRERGGFCRLQDAGPFRDVGCESCHGPGSAHVKAPSADNVRSGAEEATCAAGCHVPEHSDGFDYERYVERITGPSHERRSAK